jgi:cyclic-di-GMP phosphodiesterase TipF (flagellum assembly factor)
MAFGLGLFVQAGLEPTYAAITALAAFVAMVAGHTALRRADLTGLARQPKADPVIDQAIPTTGANKTPGLRSAANFDARARKGSRQDAKAATNASDSSQVTDHVARAPGRKDTETALNDLDLGNFRPRSPADLSSSPAGRPQPDGDGGDIDQMIRRLADDIEAGRKQPAKSESAAAQQKTAATLDSVKPNARRTGNHAPPPLPKAQPAGDNQAPTLPPLGPAPVVAPVVAKTTVTPAQPDKPSFPPQMPASVKDGRSPVPNAPPPTPTATAKLAAIADALSDEQMDVYLETINGLEDYRAQHYEVSVRLRLADGELMDNSGFISETRGTGLLPLLEAVKVSSTKRLAVQMMRRGRTGEFFSTVDGEALMDEQFGSDIDTITAGDKKLAARLVLAFSQADIRGLTPGQLKTLRSIADLGFRFSIEDITDLDMDFAELAAQGFTFAKLDAEVFLKGLPTGTGLVPSADICRHLEHSGLSLIVGKINDENARVKIVGFGAALGQGALFGSPRPVRADILKPSRDQ